MVIWIKCNKCGKHKALYNFIRDIKASFGVQKICKACLSIQYQEKRNNRKNTIVRCNKCGYYFRGDFVNKSRKCRSCAGNRGRPKGYRLSEASKQQIAESKTGYKHDEVTKDKISNTLIAYFMEVKPASVDLKWDYKDNPEAMEWIQQNASAFDRDNDLVSPSRKIKYARTRRESNFTDIKHLLTIKGNIRGDSSSYEDLHLADPNGISPEIMLIVKEHCEINGLDMEEFIDSIL